MPLSEMFESASAKQRTLHYANIVKMALIDGAINEQEQVLLDKLARKLGISDDKVSRILEQIDAYPIPSVVEKEKRFEYLFELFKIIYADHEIDEPEMKFLHKYAIGLGFSETQAKTYISRSVKLFSGNFTFEEYQFFINS